MKPISGQWIRKVFGVFGVSNVSAAPAYSVWQQYYGEFRAWCSGFPYLRVRTITRHTSFSQFPHVTWYLEPREEFSFNIQHLRYPLVTRPTNVCMSRQQDYININEDCFDNKRRLARCIDDVPHIFNVIAPSCRIWVDNLWRLAS